PATPPPLPSFPTRRSSDLSSSGIAVAALVRGWGGEPTLFDIARDEASLIEDRIAAGAQHDLLITLGGASVGDHDLVQAALKAQGDRKSTRLNSSHVASSYA